MTDYTDNRSFATKTMDFFKGWFTDDTTGEFSWKKTALSVAGLGILAWAQQNMPVLFYITMAFLAVGVAMIATGTVEVTVDGRQRAQAQGLGQSPHLAQGGPQQQPILTTPEPPPLNLNGVQLGSLQSIPVATVEGTLPRQDLPFNTASLPGSQGRDLI